MTSNYLPSGFIHTPLTPFTTAGAIDRALIERLVDFHIAQGASAICAPTHIGESPSLTEDERRDLMRVVLSAAHGRVPVIAHVSRSGTMLTAESARDAQEAGAAAIMVSPPYYWTPPAHMLLEHFGQVAKAVDIPVLVYNAPGEMAKVTLSADLMLKLIERAPNCVGLVDLSLDWQFLLELLPQAKKKREHFVLLAGAEYMVSTQAIGGAGSLSALAAIAPNMLRQLFDLCSKERYVEARRLQFTASELRQLLKPWPAKCIKAAMEMMGRPVGDTRPPVMPLSVEDKRHLWRALEASRILDSEPRGW